MNILFKKDKNTLKKSSQPQRQKVRALILDIGLR
ncbi:hypothetical protein NUACC26_084080 [Scytonema sp. NUACC26]